MFPNCRIFFNILLGLIVLVSRSVMWFFLGLTHLTRMDKCIYPSPGALSVLDAGYATYVALARQDHRYNNPVSIVFSDLLLQRLLEHRRQEAMRKGRRNFRMLMIRAKYNGGDFKKATAQLWGGEEA